MPGFCDTLVLFRSGEAHGDWCKPQAGSTDTTQGVTLTTEEQNTLLEGLATIEAAVQEAVLAVDGLQGRSSLPPPLDTGRQH